MVAYPQHQYIYAAVLLTRVAMMSAEAEREHGSLLQVQFFSGSTS